MRANGGYAGSPVWSPDGTRRAYGCQTKGMLTGGSFSAGAGEILIRDVGFDARFARATPDRSRILIRVPRDAEKDRGEIRLLFGWAAGVQSGK